MFILTIQCAVITNCLMSAPYISGISYRTAHECRHSAEIAVLFLGRDPRDYGLRVVCRRR